MVALPNSSITKVEDLRGKKVGIFPGPSTLLFFSLVMKKHGLDPKKDVTLIELPPGNQIQALVGGQVNALSTLEPIATQAVLDHKAINFNPGAIEREIINPYHGGVWFLSKELINGNPEVADKVIAACYEAIDYLRVNPAEAKNALLRYTSITPPVAENTPTPSFSKAGEVDLPVFRKYANIVYEGGVVSKPIDPTSLLIDRRPVAPTP
jgi:NitT/TauT family transport system substrate-binding protein